MAETGDAPSQAPDVMMESSGRPKGKTSKDSYTVKQFKLHAVLICWLWDLRSEEEYTVVTDYIKPQDVARAAGVLATLTPAQYNELRTEVLKFESGESQYDILLTRFPAWIMAFRQGPDCRLPSNIPEELDNQSTSSKQVLEDELVLALDTIKQLKEQLRESRRSNTFSAEEIREDEIRTGRDNEQRRSRPRFSPVLGDVELERTRPRTRNALRGREGGQYDDTYYHQPYVTHDVRDSGAL